MGGNLGFEVTEWYLAIATTAPLENVPKGQEKHVSNGRTGFYGGELGFCGLVF